LTSATVSERRKPREMMSQEQIQSEAGHPYIYVVGATGTAVIYPSNGRLIVIASGVAPREEFLLVDNHYRDEFGSLWSQTSATEDGSIPAAVYVTDPKTFRNEKTIPLGQNAVHTPGLTPDGKFAVVPISTENQLNVHDTSSLQIVDNIPTGGVIGTPILM
jgi:DNA-binding beta-propeller fold protein YncE